MKRSTDRILTTHTGSLPRTAKVVELLLSEQKNPGARKAELDAAVREAIAHVVQKQIECGIDIINDGEQGRTDYTVHVLDRLTGFAGESMPPLGTGDAEFPELAQLLTHFASPFQYRPACTGEVTWNDWATAQADIDLPKDMMNGADAAELFMTSPSPGQIARYLKNKHYKTEEAYVYALADVMKREYKAIVDAGFILQLDCPDLAMLRHTVYLDKSSRRFPQDHRGECRGAQSRGRRYSSRPHAHACMLGLDRGAAPYRRADHRHHRHRADRKAACRVVPRRQCAARARMENLARGQAARRQGDHTGRHRFRR